MGLQHPLKPGAALRLLTSSGEVTVTAEDRDDLDVEPPDRRVEMKDGGRTAEVKARSGSLRVRCPTGTDVSVGAISGRIRLAGQFGSVKVSAVSGHIEIDSASGDVDVRSVSGHLSVNACGGRCQLNTKSGSIRIGRVEKAARVSTLSGSVELGTAGEDEVEVKSISGRVTVRVAEGKRPHIKVRTLSGKLRCDCPQGTDFDIKASTFSGSVEVTGP
jgi:DUF4097 and DUF4098 domain-containing protein YvlB